MFQSEVFNWKRCKAATLAGLLVILSGCSGDATGSLSSPVPSTGSLALVVASLPTDAPAAITISNDQGFRRELTASSNLSDLPRGSYLISAAQIAVNGDWYAPAPAVQTITIDPSKPAPTVTVAYARSAPPATGAVAVTVTGLPGGTAAAVTLSRNGVAEQSLTGSATLTGLPHGTFQLTASSVVVGGSAYVAQPAIQTIEVKPGAVSPALVAYTVAAAGPVAPGSLAVTITGLPAGTDAAVQVTNGSGFAQSLDASATLAALVPGLYTVAAANVTSGAVTYTPAQASQTTAVGSGAVASLAVTYTAVMPSTGSLAIEITGVPPGMAGSVSVTGPNGYFQWAVSSQTFTNLAPGAYTLTAEDLASPLGGYVAAPRTQTVNVVAGSTAAWTAAYAPATPAATTGTLTVAVSGLPANAAAALTVTGAGFLQLVSASQALSGLAPGAYTIAAAPVVVNGTTYAATAPSQVRTVVAGIAAPVAVTYMPTTGALAISFSGLPQGAAAAAVLSGPQGVAQTVTADGTIGGLAPGHYSLTVNAVTVNGTTYLAAVSPASATVNAGVTTVLAIGYAPAITSPSSPSTPPPPPPPPPTTPAPATGSITVTFAGLPAGSGGSVTVRSGTGYFQWFTSTQTLASLAPGDYTVAAGNVNVGSASYVPSFYSQVITVAGGTAASVTVTYTASAPAAPVTGSLNVSIAGLPAGTSASVAIGGPSSYSQSLAGSQTLSSLVPGTYTVAAANVTVSGTVYAASVPSQAVMVTAGTTASASVIYAAVPPSVGALAISVGGIPAGAPATVTVTGPGSYSRQISATQTLTGLVPGSYTIAAANVTVSGTVYAASVPSQTATVTTGATASASVTYAAVPPSVGSLAVSVSGVPAGASATVTVTGPGGYSRQVSATQTLTGLVPGSYTVAAAPLSAWGFSYSASPASQSRTVVANSSVSAAVAYAASSATLAVTVNGLPAGTNASVTVTGGLVSQVLTGSQSLTGLLGGVFTITAANVTSGSVTYAPSPATQTQTAILGSAVTATVTYTAVPAAPPGLPAWTPGYHVRSMVLDGVTYAYQIFIPATYTPTVRVPVILSLHGSGEAGTNNTAQLTVGLGPYVTANASTFPAVVVFAQYPTNNGGYSGEAARDFQRRLYMLAFNQTLAEVNADPLRLYINGNSIGAVRAWDLLYRYSTTWAGAILTSGFLYGPGLTSNSSTTDAQGQALAAARLATMPIHTYHGSADPNDPATGLIEDRDINLAFHGPSATFKYTEYANAGHSTTWVMAYNDPATWSWLFAQHR